jgi:hypothetical protein
MPSYQAELTKRARPRCGSSDERGRLAGAAAYLDISKTKFLEGVAADLWPAPRDVGGLPRWDRFDLDAAVEGAIISKYRNAGQTCVCAIGVDPAIHLPEGIAGHQQRKERNAPHGRPRMTSRKPSLTGMLQAISTQLRPSTWTQQMRQLPATDSFGCQQK